MTLKSDPGPVSTLGLIADLSDALAIPWHEVIHRAMVLYAFALEADGDGNRLAVLSLDDEIVREVIGLRPQGDGTPSGRIADLGRLPG